MAEFEGVVRRITYRNEENGYTVFTLDGKEEDYSVVGTFPLLSDGESIKISGDYVLHPTYGPQIKAASYEFVRPKSVTAVEKYLASGAIKGIGERLAQRIVKKFGEDTFRILEEEPERLSEINGISDRMALDMANQVVGKRDLRNACLTLQKLGISISMAIKIWNEFGKDYYEILTKNPYAFAETMDGFGFQTADLVAANLNIRFDSPFRIRAGILHVLDLSEREGNTFVEKEALKLRTEGLLSVVFEDFDTLLEEMQADKKIVIKKMDEYTAVYRFSAYRAEVNVARKLLDMNVFDSEVTDKEIEKKISEFEKRENILLAEGQKEAVKTASKSGVTIITGGPGTGKTTIINALIHIFLSEGLNLALAAPTGRAAKRMTEATGYEAKTIHRLLEVRVSDEGLNRFGKNAMSPLEEDVLIIDEVSMVDIYLMQSLLEACVAGMRIVLVGDADQLPSVGPGEVLKELIDSQVFPVVSLNRIFRQQSGSDIVVNAHKINRGEKVEMEKSDDFLFALRKNPDDALATLLGLISDQLPKYLKVPAREIQVLAPKKNGKLGVNALNQALQNKLNPPSVTKKEKKHGDILFREGDKVMQIKNDYQLEWSISYPDRTERGAGVFNGDIGIIDSIRSAEEKVVVLFDDGRKVEYSFVDLDELELSYAVTIHKSQGSEYPGIILPLYGEGERFLNRRLLYTAVTRARSCVLIIGSFGAFQWMIQNDEKTKRLTGLKHWILEISK